MGIRGELFSTRVSCEGRTYFFNVKQNRMGDVFLTVVESKPTEAETFDRRSIVIFREDMRGFLEAFQTTLSYMEKPGTAPRALSFDPAPDAPRPARRKPGEAAVDAGGKALGDKAPARKRRVVVKRAHRDSDLPSGDLPSGDRRPGERRPGEGSGSGTAES